MTRSWLAAASCLFWGSLADCDHVLDFLIFNRFRPDVAKLRRTYLDYRYHMPKEYLLFHSYELVGVMAALAALTPSRAFWGGAAVGLLLHLLADQRTNSVYTHTYFFVFRLRNGFDPETFFTDHAERILPEELK